MKVEGDAAPVPDESPAAEEPGSQEAPVVEKKTTVDSFTVGKSLQQRRRHHHTLPSSGLRVRWLHQRHPPLSTA